MPTAKEFLDKYWDGHLPIDAAAIAKKAGIAVIMDPSLVKEGLSGRFAVENGAPAIRCNPSDVLVRRRFTIAHELGHFALGHGAAYRDPAAHFSAKTFEPDEAAANHFAAQLLMPAELVKTVIKEQGSPTVESLSKRFGVSPMAMKYRLTNLGWLRG